MTYFDALKRFWKLFPDSGLDLADIGLMSAFLHLWNEAGRPDTMPIATRHFTESLGIPEASFFRRRDQLIQGGFLEVTPGRRGQSPVYCLALNMRAKSTLNSSQNESQNSSQNESQVKDSSQNSSQDCSQNESPIYREEEKEYKEDPKPLNAFAPPTQVPTDGPSLDVFLSAASLLNPAMNREDATALWNHYTVRDWQDGMKRSLLRHWRVWQGLPGTRQFAAKLAAEAQAFQRSTGSQDRDRKSNTARQPPQEVLDAAWLAYGGDLPAPAWLSLKANAAQLNAMATAHPPLQKLLATP